ncbi:hypothetical protein PLIIFM63780_001104 [Purpureocillium lilacinum]|uniref:Uncharacterized protein n=2 Tax=Purpureocillium lilacinum TaxID=33203 RepID=A0ACC4E6M5_PURLI|nr:DNA-binding protein SMUBP-2 [Purpureocillium lilacinum]GJN68710.1 hypothetical protein PLICBS_002754 [Purpureocillium lilacinum]GJN77612.1 hypothetical protein PLIIFM63780_001104 [Purpureocillium lilacinum]
MADDGSGRVAAAAAGGPDAGGDNHGNLASTSTRTAAAVSSGPEPGPGPGQGLQQTPSRAVSFRNLNHHRRQSQSERISEILETARSRAESMSPEPGPAASRQASSLQQQGNHQLSGDEVSADELTGFMSRGSSRSYHAVQRTGTSRSRRSIYDHPSQPQVDEDDELPARRSTRRSSRGSTNGPSDSNGRPGKGDDKEELTWWRKPLGTFQSIELENKGSVARDHLALERTFLAWLRTSLAFASIGIAVTQLFRLNTSLSDTGSDIGSGTLKRLGKPLGATFLAISILTLLLGFRRYFHGQDWVIKGKFPASRGTIIVVAFVALAIMVVSLVVVIVIHPTEDMDL